MKVFLGCDITNDKKNEAINGDAFLKATPTEEQNALYRQSVENAFGLVEKTKLPAPLRVAEWICGFLGAIGALGILKALADGEEKLSLAQAYENAGWLFWLVGGLLVAWAVLFCLAKHKEKTTLEENSTEKITNDLDTVAKAIYDSLGVPENAVEVDVLSFSYVTKEGRPQVKERGLSTPYMNMVMSAYIENDTLCLTNLDGKYVFPLSSLRAIRTVKKSVQIPSWNKELPHSDAMYKPYKMTEDKYGSIHTKPYHILELERDGEAWGIYFPCYELPTFQALTGLSPLSPDTDAEEEEAEASANENIKKN